MIKSGMDVAFVSRMLGHTTITTTYNRYVKPLKSDLEQAVSELDLAYSISEKPTQTYLKRLSRW